MSNSQLQVEVNNRQQEEDGTRQENAQTNTENIRGEDYEEEEEEDEPDYKVDKMMPRQNTKEKLIEQNIKLKAQIYELAVQLDQILNKDRTKKKKYGLAKEEDDDEAVKAKKLQLKRQQLTIVETKNTIFQLKRQLDSVFNNEIVQQNQDRLKSLKISLKQIEQQKDGLVKIKKGQAKAIKTIKNEEQFKQKIDQTHKEVVKLKEQTKKMMDRVREARKNEISSHQNYVNKKMEVRELQNRMAINKGLKQKTNKKINPNSKDAISNQMISQLEEEIKKLDIEKRQGQKIWQDKIRAIEGELQIKRLEEQKKLLILREKQKQLKLNQIRIRQLRKLVKQNIIAEHTKKGEDVDMSQYRHRRNIRYMEK